MTPDAIEKNKINFAVFKDLFVRVPLKKRGSIKVKHNNQIAQVSESCSMGEELH